LKKQTNKRQAKQNTNKANQNPISDKFHSLTVCIFIKGLVIY
jgi:hypothetical protein